MVNERRGFLAGPIQGTKPDTDAIKAAAMCQDEVAGADVKRGYHLRVA
jgi:hypothetical protein